MFSKEKQDKSVKLVAKRTYQCVLWCGMYSVSCGKNPWFVPAALPYVEIAFNPDVISVFIFGSRVSKFKF